MEAGSKESDSGAGSDWLNCSPGLAAGRNRVLDSVAVEVGRMEQLVTGLVAGPVEAEGMNHQCSCTGEMSGLGMAGRRSMTDSLESHRSDTPDKMGQSCAAAGDSVPSRVVLEGAGSLVCYQFDRMKRYCAAAAGIAAVEG